MASQVADWAICAVAGSCVSVNTCPVPLACDTFVSLCNTSLNLFLSEILISVMCLFCLQPFSHRWLFTLCNDLSVLHKVQYHWLYLTNNKLVPLNSHKLMQFVRSTSTSLPFPLCTTAMSQYNFRQIDYSLCSAFLQREWKLVMKEENYAAAWQRS